MVKILKKSIYRVNGLAHRKRMVAVTSILLILTILSTALLTACSSDKANDAYKYELTDYMKVCDIYSITVSEDDVLDELKSRIYDFLWGYEFTEQVYDVEVQKYDAVIVDYVCFIDGLAIDSFGATGATVCIGEGLLLEELENGIIGMNIGDVKEIDITFPEEYYEGLGGVEATYSITLQEIHRPLELTDEMCRSHTVYSSVAELREKLSRTIAAELAFEKIVLGTEIISYPQAEYDTLYADVTYLKKFAESKDMTLKEVLEQYGDQFSAYGFYSGMTEEEYYKVCDELVKEQMKDEMILYYLLRELNVKTNGKNYNAEGKLLLSEYACDDAEHYDELYGEGSYNYSVLYNLALKALYGIITVS